MANVKAKTQKKAAKAKPAISAKATRSAEAAAAKAKSASKGKKKGAPTPKKPVAKAKAGAKAPAGRSVLKKKVTSKPGKTSGARTVGKAMAKPALEKGTKAPAPKAAAAVKKPAPAIKTVPAKAQPKPVAAKTLPAAKPTAPAKPAPVGMPTPNAPVAKVPAPSTAKPAPEKLVAPATITPAKVAEKPAAPPAPKKEPVPKASTSKETKPKAPVVAVMTGVEPIGGPAKTLKRAMKERFSVEFYMNATPSSLYDMFSTPSGLSEWFCDDVDVRGDLFTFRWGNDMQIAQCLSRKFGELLRFQWEADEDEGAYFELRIRIDPMTNETCLIVTDHAWPKELDEAKALWGSQIQALQRVLGA